MKKITIIIPLFFLAPWLFCGKPVQAQSPVSLRIAPLYYDLDISPGEEKTVDVFVENLSEKTVQLKAELSDFFIDTAGNYIFSGQKEILNDKLRPYLARDWLSAGQDSLVLSEGEGKVVKIKIAVPPDAVLGGHYGAAFFRSECKIEKDPAVVSTDKSSLCLSGRVGTLFLLRVGGEGVRKGALKKITAPKISFQDKAGLSVEIENVGNTHFRPEGRIAVKNIFGQEISKIEIKDKIILPTLSRVFSESLTRKDLLGFYKIQGLIKDGDGSDMTFRRYVFLPPWKEILAAALIVTALVWFFKIFKIKKIKK